jgi:Ricin-type beta-trefoil lectin domain
MRSFPRPWILAVSIAPCAIGLIATGGPSSASQSNEQTKAASARQPAAVEVYATYYGWYDNTPPGCATAYSGCAAGSGTYQDPITFASDKQEFPVGTILYYPTIEKYVVMGDDCQECDQDWSGNGPDGGPHLHHVDLWIGGKRGNEFDVINCEDALTQGMPDGAPLLTPFIVNPPADLPVSTEPLFNSRTDQCFGGATTSTTYGQYKNAQSGTCLEDPGYSAKPGTPAELAPCSASAAETIAFDGAFFVVHHLCLQTASGKAGAAITFTTCNGNDRQQWEINNNRTITWIQYPRCIADVSGKVELATCASASADRWDFTSAGA